MAGTDMGRETPDREPLVGSDPLGLGGTTPPDAPSRHPKPRILALLGEFLRMSRTTVILLVAFLLVGALYLLVREDPVVGFGPPPPAPTPTAPPQETDGAPTGTTDQPTAPTATPTPTAPTGTGVTEPPSAPGRTGTSGPVGTSAPGGAGETTPQAPQAPQDSAPQDSAPEGRQAPADGAAGAAQPQPNG